MVKGRFKLNRRVREEKIISLQKYRLRGSHALGSWLRLAMRVHTPLWFELGEAL
jgi:hypothetical protein